VLAWLASSHLRRRNAAGWRGLTHWHLSYPAAGARNGVINAAAFFAHLSAAS